LFRSIAGNSVVAGARHKGTQRPQIALLIFPQFSLLPPLHHIAMDGIPMARNCKLGGIDG
jgi:hypothetical protein